MKLGVLTVGQGSTPFQEFVESRSWPGHHWGYTSQTCTRRSSVLLQRQNIKVDVSVLVLFVLQRSLGQFWVMGSCAPVHRRPMEALENSFKIK